MKVIILFAIVAITACSAKPQQQQQATAQAGGSGANPNDVSIKSESFTISPQGYKFGYDLSDGQKVDAEGTVNAASDSKNETIAVKGSYSFIAPDGQTYSVNYVADENGYQPQGAHLPQASQAPQA